MSLPSFTSFLSFPSFPLFPSHLPLLAFQTPLANPILRLALAVLALGLVFGLVFFLAGLGRGLRGPAGAGARPARIRRPGTVRALLLIMGLTLFGGAALARPSLLVIGLACLALAYAVSRWG